MRSSGLFRLDETHPDWIFKPFLQTSFHLNKPAEFKYHCVFFFSRQTLRLPERKGCFQIADSFVSWRFWRLNLVWKSESLNLSPPFPSLSFPSEDILIVCHLSLEVGSTWFSDFTSLTVWGEVFSNEESGGVKVCLLSSAGELTWFGVNVVNVLTPLLLFTPKCHLPAGGRDAFH